MISFGNSGGYLWDDGSDNAAHTSREPSACHGDGIFRRQ